MTPRKLGKRDGLRYAITWLHRRAEGMNDPKATAILNSAAFDLGNEIREGHVPPISDKEACSHAGYRGMSVHGRCCPDCAAVMVDFSDDTNYSQEKYLTEHVLKTAAVYWDAVERGDKTFEVLRDDRGFQRGDTLVLERCYDPDHYDRYLYGHDYEVERDSKGEPRHTIRRVISYILSGGQLGIEAGYVVLALTDSKPR
jgi:hypothetical protein